MGTLTIVGLGPGSSRHLTQEAQSLLETAEEVWLRTKHHPIVGELPPHLVLHSFDDLYERADDFSQVYDTIVGELLRLGQRPGGAIYAVPGHPLVGEASVTQVLSQKDEAGLDVRIVEGLSFVGPTLTALGIDALSGLQICDAVALAARNHPPLNPDLPALVGQLYSRPLAADVKLTLMNQYPDDHQVVLVHAAGTPEQRVERFPLFELDRQQGIAHLTTLFVPPLPALGGFEGLQDTVAHLRAPNGCPWDREQTHESLRSNLLEETYEVLAAIDAASPPALQEELGDLLLQIVLHAQIATEEGEFKMPAVVAGIDTKLKRRHPHVWGDRVVQGSAEVVRRWEQLKREEWEEKGTERSVLEGVPQVLPALLQADIYGRRAARVGFDWTDVGGVIDKVSEEIGELHSATGPVEREAELGDLLFAVANWARWLGVDPEAALRKANGRFAARFQAVEAQAREHGRDASSFTLDELEAFWQRAKLNGE